VAAVAVVALLVVAYGAVAAPAAAPPNDMFSAAQVLIGEGGAVAGSTAGATKERGEPKHAGNKGGRSIWYRWTAPFTGTASFNTFGSGIDTLLAVYQGTSVGSLTAVAANDNWSDGTTSRVRFSASAGTTYSIAVDGKNGAAGPVSLSWWLASGPPANDMLSAAQALVGTAGETQGWTVGATRETGEPNHLGAAGGRSVWYRWTAEADGQATVSTAGSDFDTQLAVYRGSALASLTLVAENENDGSAWTSRVAFNASAGTTYRIAVDGRNGDVGRLRLAWSGPGPDTAPPTVVLTAPAEGALVRGAVTLAATAADDGGVASVAFLVDGSPVGSDSSAPFAVIWDSASRPDGSATIVARAVDLAGNEGLSAPRSVTVDNTPPETTIVSGPEGTVASGSATFSFSSSEGGSSFECRLDGGGWAACTSPLAYSGLGAGDHTFEVAAVDAAGNRDPTPAGRTWTVASTQEPPETAILSGPSGVSRTSLPVFTFASDREGAAFECSLDGAPFEPCASPHTAGVANGGHTLRVRSLSSGATDPTPASRSWWQDALIPNPAFEASSAGWSGYTVPGWVPYPGVLSLVGGGIVGPTAVRAAYGGSGSSYAIFSAPAVSSTAPGAVYTASAWLRSQTPGKTVCLRIREFTGTTIVGYSQRCAVTSLSWQPVGPFSYTAAGSNRLEVYAYQSSAVAGDSFDLDGFALDGGPAPPAAAPPPPAGSERLVAVGDIAYCGSLGDEATARIVDSLPGTVQLLGDTAYESGTPDEFAGCYEPSWGRFKERTRPAVGDHEYRTAGAAGYFGYFGSSAGDPAKGYYSYDLGSWHVVVLNSTCDQVGGCGPGSPQEQWLRADLALHPVQCTLAVIPTPRFSSGNVHGNNAAVQPFWQALYDAGADVVLSGDEHVYERFAPQTPTGGADPDFGLRQFTVGTGGRMLYGFSSPLPNSEARYAGGFGVLELTLSPGTYTWRFLSEEGKTFSDSGSSTCHGSPLPADTALPAVTLTSPAEGATVGGTVTVAADASDDRGIARVEFRAGSQTIGVDTTAPYSVPWDTSGLADGPVVLAARAVDGAGNEAVSSRTVTVRNTPPDTVIDSGPEGTVSSSSATFSFSSPTAGVGFQCRLDGGSFSPCSSPVTYTGLAGGLHTFEVRAVAGGLADPTPAARAWTVDLPAPVNLISNPGFEDSLSGWGVYKGSLALASPGANDSRAAARVTANGTSSMPVLNLTSWPVASTVAGRAYVARAWVRASPARTVCLRFREYAGSTLVGSASACVAAAEAWQQLPELSYTAVGTGNQLEIYFHCRDAVTGDFYDVDDVVLSERP